jgi:predicted ester cyclase
LLLLITAGADAGETIKGLTVEYRPRPSASTSFLGIPPSGRQVRVPFCDWTQVRDGKAVAHWGVSDSSALVG